MVYIVLYTLCHLMDSAGERELLLYRVTQGHFHLSLLFLFVVPSPVLLFYRKKKKKKNKKKISIHYNNLGAHASLLSPCHLIGIKTTAPVAMLLVLILVLLIVESCDSHQLDCLHVLWCCNSTSLLLSLFFFFCSIFLIYTYTFVLSLEKGKGIVNYTIKNNGTEKQKRKLNKTTASPSPEGRTTN